MVIAVNDGSGNADKGAASFLTEKFVQGQAHPQLEIVPPHEIAGFMLMMSDESQVIGDKFHRYSFRYGYRA